MEQIDDLHYSADILEESGRYVRVLLADGIVPPDDLQSKH